MQNDKTGTAPGEDQEQESQPQQEQEQEDMFPPDAYLPITCTRWEDQVVFDGEDIREEMLKKLTSGRQPICGWIPTQQTRTYESFMAMCKYGVISDRSAIGGHD